MTVSTEDAEKLMKRCQTSVGDRNRWGALDDAHSIMADCYSSIGSLVQERDRLLRELDNMAENPHHNNYDPHKL